MGEGCQLMPPVFVDQISIVDKVLLLGVTLLRYLVE